MSSLDNIQGEAECRRAGMLLASMGFEFDLAYTSVLKVRPPYWHFRTIKSLHENMVIHT
jgi:bisphosphoglycerate-dependent phosphoglycerate mutase